MSAGERCVYDVRACGLVKGLPEDGEAERVGLRTHVYSLGVLVGGGDMEKCATGV